MSVISFTKLDSKTSLQAKVAFTMAIIAIMIPMMIIADSKPNWPFLVPKYTK
ncbi:MAG: hypothetical protein LDL06_02925 [Candidatus Nitrosotenuis sp.]|nr:hypothetical protein [Candidatus Nitrosotenuis sp.]